MRYSHDSRATYVGEFLHHHHIAWRFEQPHVFVKAAFCIMYLSRSRTNPVLEVCNCCAQSTLKKLHPTMPNDHLSGTMIKEFLGSIQHPSH
ncbi:hypothetical protein F383_30974 [Gossypium arboreum]|uniref:Uncharacterized protein n=1 Tax=Gossypium arboreum TaxID=29729 RepID=A0A0B0PJC7_GOSAR|nr:hypothetical protein F383_30974 [Gossypium arboreum]